MDDSIEWGPPFKEMDFEFLEFSLVGSYWMVFSARFSYKSHPLFSSFYKNPLGTLFLRGFWLSNLNRHKEFGIIAISLFLDEDIMLKLVLMKTFVKHVIWSSNTRRIKSST